MMIFNPILSSKNKTSHLNLMVNTIFGNLGFRRYVANASWLFAEQVLRMIAGLLIGVWIARVLGPQQFGIFSYMLAFVSIFGCIAKLGLDNILVRELVTYPERLNIYLGTAFWMKAMGGTLIFLLACVIIGMSENESSTKLYICIISSGLIFQAFDVVGFYFQAKVTSRLLSLCKIAQLLISVTLKIYFVLAGLDMFWLVLISLVDQITLAISLSIAYASQKLDNFYKHFNFELAKKMLKDSWPLILSGLAVMIYMRIDQLMIKEMLGEKELGLYSAATKLCEVWYFIPMIITSSLFPAIVNAKNKDQSLYQSRLQNLYTFLVWVAIAIALPITFLSDWIIVQLFGEAYRQGGQVLMIQIWASIFVFLGVASSSWLVSENLQKLSFFRTFSGMVVNVILNLILIPKFGIVGAAIATLVSYCVASLLFDFFNKKTRKMFTMKINAFLLKRGQY